jgi:hypothetical protein
MKRGRNAAGRLRAAVEMLPIDTQRAMLVGLDNEAIITGAYTHGDGVCPLRVMLEASLEEPISLMEVKRPKRDTGERNRMPELRKRHGWAWSRLFRRWDTWSAALATFEDREAADGGREEAPVLVPDLTR